MDWMGKWIDEPMNELDGQMNKNDVMNQRLKSMDWFDEGKHEVNE